MLFEGKSKEYLLVEEVSDVNCFLLKQSISDGLTLIWITEDETILLIDGKEHIFEKNQIVCTTEFHKVNVKKVGKINLIRFNRPFYCILDHDDEVSCKGLLFFGATQLPIITLPAEEIEKYEILWRMLSMEMDSKDNLQLDMLQMMIKRLLILCTRVYKSQENYTKLETISSDVIREYNFLVEEHFRTKHTVSEYADLLFKSPKTLSNLFAKLGEKTPLEYIKERILLEARRLLMYTEKPIKEIAYELGYEDIQSFSRFFKKHEQISPSDFRKNQ